MTAPPPIPVLDRIEAIRRTGGDEKLAKELTAVFLADLPRLTQLIKAAIDQHSAEALNNAAHSLRGSASQIGAMAVAERAAILEKIGKDGDLQDAAQQQAHLEEDLRQLLAALKA